MVVLDTDLLSLLERRNSLKAEELRQRLTAEGQENVFATIVSYEEQVRGWMGYIAKKHSLAEQIDGYRKLRQQLENYCSLNLLDFDELAAVEFQRLKREKVRVGTMDMKIAAIALSQRARLWTRNLADFRKIPDLLVEGWID